jgi:hypothetical protein
MVGVRVIARLEFRWVGAVWKAWDGLTVRWRLPSRRRFLLGEAASGGRTCVQLWRYVSVQLLRAESAARGGDSCMTSAQKKASIGNPINVDLRAMVQ